MIDKIKFIVVICLGLYLFPLGLFAQNVNQNEEENLNAISADSIQISILTCSPGPEVYALYGHMAIRFQNTNTGDDIVFNYGTFNMNAPFFIPKFTLGMMDYELGIQPFIYFYRHYSYDGCSITQQELNLSIEEKQRFLDALLTNYKPENRAYRYNFMYDNCATRPREILERIVNGRIVYEPDSTRVTYRQMLHGFNERWPWSKLGVDLVLGAEADLFRTAWEQEWIPSYLLNHFSTAKIEDGEGNFRPLIKNTIILPAEQPMDESEEFPLTPMTCALLLLGLGVLISAIEYYRKKICIAWDTLVFLVQGIVGFILFLLVFFSEHPCTGSNWLIVLFNPLPILFLYRIISRGRKQKKDLYHLIYGVVLTLFMVFFAIIPQDIPLEVLPLALVLLSRHINHLVICKK